MPTIEQVSKRLFSDRNWLKKLAIGMALSVFPIVNFIVLGALYRIFRAGKRNEDFALPEWDDFKGLFLDGLRLLVIGLIFTALPIGLVQACTYFIDEPLLARLPLMPVLFLVGPLTCAALYLYMVKEDIGDCFNIDALGIMLRNAAPLYVVPTLALLGLGFLTRPLFPLIYPGAVFYVYLMAFAFRNLERRGGRNA